MRFLVAQPGPNFSVQDVYVGWVEALRAAGQQVVEFNLDVRLTFFGEVLLPVGQSVFRRALTSEHAIQLATDGINSALYKVRPDVLLVVSGFFLSPEVLARARSYGTRVVILHTESPYEDERQLKLAPYADINLLNDPTNAEAFAEHAPTYYVPHAYRPSIHHPGDPVDEYECDLAFVGTGYHSRIAFFEAMDLAGLDVLLAGNWQALDEDSSLLRYVSHDLDECLDNTVTADVYRSARVGLNLYRREAQAQHLVSGGAMGPREVEMAACGLFFLRDPRPESDEVLGMLPAFDGPQDAAERLRWWLARPEDRRELALKAREAIADRTFDHHAARLLRLLEP